jgi:hypothetical protein
VRGNNKDLVFQAAPFTFGNIAPLKKVTAVYTREVRRIVRHFRTLTFEKLVYIKVSLHVSRIPQ